MWQSLLADPWVIGAAAGVVATAVAFVIGRILLAPAAPKPGWTNPETPDVDVFTSQSPRDRRIANRRTGNPVEVELIDPDQPSGLSGWIVDRSLGGLCIEVERPVSVGKKLQVKVRSAAASMPLVELEVKSCRAEGSDWRLGCQFVKTPPYNVLLLFG